MAVAFFPRSSKYFPVSQPAVLNFQLHDLNGVLEKLSAAGVSVDAKREEYDYGRFGWFTDRGKQGRALAAASVNLLAGRRASV